MLGIVGRRKRLCRRNGLCKRGNRRNRTSCDGGGGGGGGRAIAEANL